MGLVRLMISGGSCPYVRASVRASVAPPPVPGRSGCVCAIEIHSRLIFGEKAFLLTAQLVLEEEGNYAEIDLV